MGPHKAQKCRKLFQKWEKLFTRGVPAEERDGDHKANPRDVEMGMEGMRDRSEKKRKKSDTATQELINSENVIFSTVRRYYYNYSLLK